MGPHKGQQFRHTPAFILLFLAQSDAYGGTLLTRLENELPAYRSDSAIIYRTLQSLEEEGAVASYWEHESSGPPKKWYRITAAGHQRLRELRDDIRARQQNLAYFLQTYETMFGRES
ncbi:MAG TPA: PadR family transcriptional regulator [Symbiobacteriaceae bacterium]|jgi:DNA-binding PadR family transcriptional regulator